MPWCPSCNNEYDEEILKCIDCDSELYHSFYQSKDKSMLEKLQNFFTYSQLNSIITYNESNELYVLSVFESKLDEAKKLYQAFHYVEKENQASIEEELNKTSLYDEHLERDSDSTIDSETEDVSQDSVYVMKTEIYNDYMATVNTFLFFGIGGLVFVLLNIMGPLDLLKGPLSNIVMGGLFVFFIFVGLNTAQKAKKIKPEIKEENQLTEQINNWLKKNITQDYLNNFNISDKSHHNYDEVTYFKQTEAIKKDITKEFGKQNPAYLDRIIEDYYSNHL